MALATGLALACSACGTATSATSSTTEAPHHVSKSAASLETPKTTAAQDTQYLADVAKLDGTLSSYVQSHEDTALQALLTDGTAFCAFLATGKGVDNALVSVALGARSVESTTHLPESVTTFNTIEAVALVTLCPSEQRLVPAATRERLASLAKTLAG